MFVPYHIENWVLMVDSCELSLMAFPTKTLQVIISCLQINYCATLDKMFILNPSFGLKASWSVVEIVLDSEVK
jgi:hypothetical protein